MDRIDMIIFNNISNREYDFNKEDYINISKIYIHSSNSIGRENMYRYLLSALRANQIYGVEVFPYKYK